MNVNHQSVLDLEEVLAGYEQNQGSLSMDSMSEDNCACTGSCGYSCSGACSGDCGRSCHGTCEGGCQDTCYSTCSGSADR